MSTGAPLVVLLHGLARRHESMARMATALQRANFATWSQNYPSRQLGIADAAALVADRLAPYASGRPLYAVTHSLGGLLVRHMRDPRLNWQRIVMLAPPNNGSERARIMANNPLLRWFYGPAGDELAAPRGTWPAPPAPFAIIAGTRRLAVSNPISWTSMRRFAAGVSHDGTVAVDETRLPDAADFLTVDATHTWIMNEPAVHAAVISFFRTGRFATRPRT